ncbi:MAG: glycerol-3-phosphate dehydrogenase/oxidase [Bacteroidetes bacterium]|nr:glycerol-3-phosphate dehydrogenase/oxidase [Bacteroidota bacterium]
MTRQYMLEQLEANTKEWDICIIGGGATGLGTAIDAASRGLETLLLEQYDFAKGTSSRSTKLVHGGVRYLQQGNIKLVTEALKERGLLRQNAPHLVKDQSFIVPNYKWWEGPFYGIGLKIYDWMAGSLGLGPSRFLDKEETLALAPTLDGEGLRGGVLYHDGQFDDARLAINLASTASEQGAVLLNYMPVTGLLKANNKLQGVQAKDALTGQEYEIKAKVVINATGVFSDAILDMDEPGHEKIIAPSQGIHLVFDKSFLPGNAAVLVPHTDDGRVLFAVPWHNKVIAGTTDTPIETKDPALLLEPRALEEEIAFVLNTIGKYLSKDPTRADIKSMFAGLRPLVKGNAKTTAALSRDHHIEISDAGLITITGGKWTTYRKMAEDVVDIAIRQAGLPDRDCVTPHLHIHGWKEEVDFTTDTYYYGSDEEGLDALIKKDPQLAALIHPDLPYSAATIVWAVQNELCMTVEDALARRTRALLLDARAAIEAAPAVAAIMARKLQKEPAWAEQQVAAFTALAKNYLPVL